MLQLQTFRLQKQQGLYKLVGKTLDVFNILLVNLVRDICSVGDLVDIVGDVIRKYVEPFQLVFVYVNDISLKNHRTDKSAECIHAAVRKLLLDSVHFRLTHSYLQVQITLILVFHILFLSSLCFYKFGVVGAAPSAKPCIMWVRCMCAHMIPCLLGVICPCGAISHFRAFQLGFFLVCQELELCDFFCFSIIVAPSLPHIHYTKDFKISQWLSEKFFRAVRNGFVKITGDILWRNNVISYFEIAKFPGLLLTSYEQKFVRISACIDMELRAII